MGGSFHIQSSVSAFRKECFQQGHPWPQLYLAPPNLEAQFYLLQKIICWGRELGILDFNLSGFGSFFFSFNIYLFGCARSPWEACEILILIAACRIFFINSWDIRDLVAWPRIKPAPPALRAQSLNHWTAGKSLNQSSCFSPIWWCYQSLNFFGGVRGKAGEVLP